MSPEKTRSTTRALPLATDDVAGISLLYPKVGLAARTARIAGRVTLDGQGVHLASVVALDTGGSAVSALTSPDGYYEITGLPPDSTTSTLIRCRPAFKPGWDPPILSTC